LPLNQATACGGSTWLKDGAVIPFKYSCDGENINPQIDIEKTPAIARSLVFMTREKGSEKKMIIFSLQKSSKSVFFGV